MTKRKILLFFRRLIKVFYRKRYIMDLSDVHRRIMCMMKERNETT